MSTQKTDPTSIETMTRAAVLIVATQANPNSVPVATGDPILDNPAVKASMEANRQRVIAAEKNLPSLSEMTRNLDELNAQVKHWDGVLEDSKAQVVGYAAKVRRAQTVLLETEGATTLRDREDRRDAEYTLEIVEPKLTLQERRVVNASAQLKTWKKRVSEFDTDRYEKLKAESKKRGGFSRRRKASRNGKNRTVLIALPI